MVQEARNITLNSRELMRALEEYRDKNPGFLPIGTITDFNITANQVFKVIIVTSDTGSTREAQLRLSDLLEPVIGFCAANNVPLPRAGLKDIEIRGSNAILKITVNHLPSATNGGKSSLMPTTTLD